MRGIVVVGDVGGPGLYHVGDEAIATADVEWLSREFPDVPLTLVSRDPEFSSRIRGVACCGEPGWFRRANSPSGLVLHSWRRRWRRLRRSFSRPSGAGDPERLSSVDAVLGAGLLYVVGGGYLTSLWPLRVRVVSGLALLARRAGVPVVTTGQTLGPDLEAAESRLLSSWLPAARWVGLRDGLSSPRFAMELGAREERIRVAPDDAYFLSDAVPSRLPAVFSCRTADPGPAVGVSLQADTEGAAAVEHVFPGVAAGLDLLSAQARARFLFLPHVTSDKEEIDLAVGRQLRAAMESGERLELEEAALLDREVKYLTSRCDLMIAGRYHAAVFALSSGVPCLGVFSGDYTGAKMRGLFSLAGCPEFAVDAREGDLTGKLLALWERREEVRSRLAESNRLLAQGFDRQRAELAGVIRECLGSRRRPGMGHR